MTESFPPYNHDDFLFLLYTTADNKESEQRCATMLQALCRSATRYDKKTKVRLLDEYQNIAWAIKHRHVELLLSTIQAHLELRYILFLLAIFNAFTIGPDNTPVVDVSEKNGFIDQTARAIMQLQSYDSTSVLVSVVRNLYISCPAGSIPPVINTQRMHFSYWPESPEDD